jgi:hypothetical protein
MSAELLASQVRATVCGVTPVPDNDTDTGELVALLVMEMLPVSLAAALGSNETLNVAVWFGLSVAPETTPDALNPVPVTLTLEMVTLDLPLFWSVTV